MTRHDYQDMSAGYEPFKAERLLYAHSHGVCRYCGDDIHLEVDPTRQRGVMAWADESFPVAPYDDRAFQCAYSPEGQHSPEASS